MATEGEGQQEPGLGTQAATAALAAAAGMRLGGVLGAAAGAGMTPYLVALVDNVRGEWQRDQRKNIADMAEAAAAAAGYSPEELGEQIGLSPRTRLLTATAAESAAKTAWPPKVIALGKVLAAGLIADDDAQIDMAQLALAAMTDMERPHVVLLDLLVHCWAATEHEDPATGEWVVDIRPRSRPEEGGWSPQAIAVARPQLGPVLASLIGMIQMHGLAAQESNWKATDLGVQVLDYYNEASY